ncbi:Clavaminate synthase-like protein [Glonium stellatum]|uniref:Clavaminate synthase-like protein n=1 Tax=Glonium stellatum TaxID=574774 RepID=A0A8E2F6J1_9PEZI|nr:Clavaminate synthase-like protein [Glonium stellatum]
MPSAIQKTSSGSDPNQLIRDCSVSPFRDNLTVSFYDATFVFHAQWLYDARCDTGPERRAPQVFCQQLNAVHVQSAEVSSSGARTTLDVTWDDGSTTPFPALWLRLLAPLVAKTQQPAAAVKESTIPKGWLANEVVIPEISYQKIMGEHLSNEEFLAKKAWILDTLLLDDSPGIIKITDLPEVDAYTEGTQVDNLLTHILKCLFGAVFQHSMRPPDATFKIASYYHESATRITELPNYDTDEILLPHVDHSHYDNPVRVQGLHAIQGHSENTFIHAFAALNTLREEDSNLYDTLCSAPYILGRVAQFYNPPLYQTTVDTAVRKMPGFPDEVKCIRWHPHLAGYLLSPYEDYEKARRAHCKFQEIMRRDSHQLKIKFNPGDMYVWDNFRLLHGRENIFSTPRMAIGQTVIEQVVNDHYRVKQMDFLSRFIGEHWLVQTPTWQLDNLVKLVKRATVGNLTPASVSINGK